MNIYLFIGSI